MYEAHGQSKVITHTIYKRKQAARIKSCEYFYMDSGFINISVDLVRLKVSWRRKFIDKGPCNNTCSHRSYFKENLI